jgi:subtilase family serine protease
VSNKKKAKQDSSLFYSTDLLYVNFAVIDGKNIDITTPFSVDLYVDGSIKKSWTISSLPGNKYFPVTDYSIGPLSAGSHMIKIVLDSSGAIVETNEGDNAYTKTIMVSPAGSDLTGSWTVPMAQTCKSSTAGTKCTMKGTFTLNNQGNSNSTSTFVNFYLSTDDTSGEGDYLLKAVSTGNLKAGASKAIKLSINLPTGETASGKYVIAAIDSNNTLAELEESNNIIVYGPIQ